MNQNIWGPHAWFLLHTLSLAYPLDPCQKDKNNYEAFLKSFSKIIPCDVCKVHYSRNLKENPLRLDNRKELFEWLVDLHNEVNGRTGKRSYTYEEALKIYEEAYQKDIQLTSAESTSTTIQSFARKFYCFWLQYHAYIIILVLLTIIYNLLGGIKGIEKFWKSNGKK